MITFLCSSCGTQLRLKPQQAGKSGRCPNCGNQIKAPLSSVEMTAATDKKTMTAPAPGTRVPPVEETAAVSAESSHPAESKLEFQKESGLESEDCAFLAPPQQTDEIGRLGPYRVLKVLGAGGMGVVFQAEDVHLKRMVALKAMKSAVAAKEINRQRFIREAQLTAAIEHDHIVPIYQVGEDRGVPYLAMKFLQGQSLDERLKQEGGWLPLAATLRIGREIAEGLAAAHERGLMHRDIKPANIWLEAGRDRVKIVDFGLARVAADDMALTQSGTIVGTPAYMAPEQAGGERVDHRCDLFSLGCVLYRLATGQLPFKGKDTMSMLMALATQAPEPPRKIDPALPASFSDLVLRLLEKNPADRPKSAEEVARSIEQIEREAAGLASPSIDLELEATKVEQARRKQTRSATTPVPNAEARPKLPRTKSEDDEPTPKARPIAKTRAEERIEDSATRRQRESSKTKSGTHKKSKGRQRQAAGANPLRSFLITGIVVGLVVVAVLALFVVRNAAK